MLMKLVFPPVTVVFFAGLFEFVTFDLIPTKEIYEKIFGWPNVAYSDEAENIGYASRYFIENAGSIPLYIAIDLTLQLIYAVAKLTIFRTGGRVRNLIEKKQESFFWAGCND